MRAQTGDVVTPPLTVAPTPLGARSPARVSARGAPHIGAIEHVVMAIDRPAALTQGSLGDIRLWTALDGSAEPIAVPIHGARTFSLAGHAQGLRIGIVDTAGSAQLWHFDARAGFAQLFADSPHRQARQVQVLPGGEHAVVLRRDHSLQLLDARGAELAGLSLRGFRPMSIRLARDGRSLVAMAARPVPSSKPKIGTQPGIESELRTARHDVIVTGVAIKIGGRSSQSRSSQSRSSLSRSTSTKLRVQSADNNPRVVVSADGRRVAFVETLLADRPLVDVHVVELPGGKPRVVAHKLPTGRHTDFGFTDERTLVVAASPEGQAWAIDVAASTAARAAGDARSSAAAARAALAHMRPVGTGASVTSARTAHAWGQGLHLTGTGRWLHVQGRAGSAGLYLGYRRFAPASVAFSPGGKKLLWVADGNVAYIEPFAEPEQRAATYASTYTSTDQGRLGHGAFIDEDTIALLDNNGRLSLVNYRTGRVLASADAGGPVGQQMIYDPATGLIHLARGERDVWLYHLSRGAADGAFALAGPYIVRTANTMHTGILRGAGQSVLWTLDEDMVYRTYSLAEIRSPMSYRDMLDRGRQIVGDKRVRPDDNEPGRMVAIDVTGRRYYHGKGQLTVYPRPGRGRGPELVRDLSSLYAFPTGNIAQLIPAPDGSRFAFFSQAFNIRVHDARTGVRLWSYNTVSNIADLTWSADGALVAVASTTGGLVLDGARGMPVHRSCGPWFEPRVAAPYLHMTTVTEAALCSR